MNWRNKKWLYTLHGISDTFTIILTINGNFHLTIDWKNKYPLSLDLGIFGGGWGVGLATNDLASFCAQGTQKRGPKPLQKRKRPICSPKILRRFLAPAKQNLDAFFRTSRTQKMYYKKVIKIISLPGHQIHLLAHDQGYKDHPRKR